MTAEFLELRPRCVYAGGSRVDGVYVLRLPCEAARYVVADCRSGCKFYGAALREEVMELLSALLGPGAVEVRPCPQSRQSPPSFSGRKT